MALTDASDVLGLMSLSQLVLASIDGVATAFMLPPEMAPEDDDLPAMIQVPRSGVISYTAGQEIVNHEWSVYACIKRGGDMFWEMSEILPYIPKLTEAFRMNTTLSHDDENPHDSIVYDARPGNFEITTINYLGEQYIGIEFTMQAKAKRGVEMH